MRPDPSGSQWFYARADETVGPVTQEQLAALVRQRALQGDTLVWREGLEDWVALRDSGAFTTRASPPPLSRGQAASDQSETILARDNIHVTRSVAQFGNTTYAINAIGSLRIDPPEPRTFQKFVGKTIVVLGLIVAIVLGSTIYDRQSTITRDDLLQALWALGIVGVGLGVWLSAKPGPYILVFRTSSADVQAYSSHDKNNILKIKQAIEHALHLRA